jgi:gliding motility-associated-like protein
MKIKNNLNVNSAMLRIIFILLLISGTSNLIAQITGDKATFQAFTNYDNGLTNDEIFVFCGTNSGELLATASDKSSGWSFAWTKWDVTSGTFNMPVSSDDTSSESKITFVSDGLYQVVISKIGEADQTYSAWVLNRDSGAKPVLNLNRKDCPGVYFDASFPGLLEYQDRGTNAAKKVQEDMIFELQRTGLTEPVVRNPYTAYSGEVKVLEDDRIFENEEEYNLIVTDKCGNTYVSDPVLSGTIAISAVFTTTPDEERKIDDGYEAPVKVEFKVDKDVNVDEYEWYIYKDNGGDPNDLGDEDLVEDGRRTNLSEFEFEFMHPGKYFVKLEVKSASCENKFIDLDGIKVVESLVDVANYFTPATQEEWVIKTQSLKSFHAIIFNRWGRIVHEWKNENESWNGKVNGKMATPGTYFYVIKAVGLEEEKTTYTKKGSFTLIRK